MSHDSHGAGDAPAHPPDGSPRARLHHVLAHAAHLLPAQGPIGVFVHHNTLHAFEDRPFHQAVLDASRLYGTEPYMTESAYRADHQRGRIRDEDLDAVLADEPDAPIVAGVSRRRLRRALLHPGVPPVDAATIRWRLEEGDLAESFGRDGEARAAFEVCLSRTPVPAVGAVAPVEARTDDAIHGWLIRLCAVFLDQGLAYWPMPGREDGFYRAVRRLLASRGVVMSSALAGADRAFASQAGLGLDAADVILRWLERAGVPDDQWEATLQRELLALPGWAGLFSVLEQQPGLAPHVRVPCRLDDFLAVRLTLDEVARRNGHAVARRTPLAPAQDRHAARAAALAAAAALVGLRATDLAALDATAWSGLVDEIEGFDEVARRRLWHLAYERWHEQDVLRAVASHRRASPPESRPRTYVSAQVFFCIDEREESMRRAVEEVDATVETLSAAGFFGVAVNYQGLDDPHGVPLCPVVVTPQHAVSERPRAEDAGLHETRAARRRLLGRVTHVFGVSSRTMLRGWISTATLGVLTAVPLIGRVLAPRAFGRLRSALNDAFLPEPRTELTLMRDDAASSERVHGLLLGFSVIEKAERVASVLAPAGLTRGFARLVVVLGHGSTSLNNPHESAHDCGACGGRRGGPNARLFAAMANHPGVRAALRLQGIDIPDTTWFVGGYHDTCSDDVQLFDTDGVPASHAEDLQRVRSVLDRARARNAHERARRFESCRLDASDAGALVHVEERAEHLAQPRPEYGHGTNAACIVGRRAVTEGLFLDRRSFLVSYDPYEDPDDTRLGRLLAAAMPVCAGISLEYYFSFVDNERYGCGTKLPHNVTGLVGVMNGQGSDLRTGLPWQMVEIHEPVRILFLIETTPTRLSRVLAGNPALDNLVRNGWIRVATLDPDSGVIDVWRGHRWERLEGPLPTLPQVRSSREWYAGRREHLGAAWVRADDRPATTATASKEAAWTR
ncbi:hypothetical protein TBR22_A40860 [Luteitalea sp. TBR-22]|uniref:DUF2309 domain-containing protein n=1 Tax=Luteitalea sp. TBR-22 TaxID=2802971 RepID=UPI001AF8D921|nr:DUF2309 domain-containing protein [Luteitalea sp. TBR-22]BCS34860.1 hypothetical protein TBR22_A40860 [Luteitalea sp. TBR-22]